MRRLPLTPCLLLLAASAAAAIPLSEPPQKLRDAAGNPEVGLVDPFVPRGSGEDPAASGDGPARTAAGELPEGFRILAISVPEKGEPTALVSMGEDEEPTLVRQGDQVRVPRGDPRARRRARAAAPDPNARFTFYLYVKTIAPTYIEVYHSKARPDDTQILRW